MDIVLQCASTKPAKIWPLLAGTKITHFYQQLRQYIERSGYNISQVSRLAGVPRRTVANWMKGYVEQPRHPGDLLKLGHALRLDGAEVDCLLRSAGYEDRQTLAGQERALADLLEPWEAAAPAPFQVIPDVPYFVGRRAELEMIGQALTTAPRTCLLYGTAGVGKSTLAARVAYLMRDEFPDGVLWAQPGRSSLMEILHASAAAYGHDVRNYGDVHTRSQAVRSLLARKRALIILDNVSSSQEAERLLPPSGVCAALVTSRRGDLRLIRGYPRFQLQPFTETEECITLFREVAGENKVAGNKEALEEISMLLGRLPLALALIAGRLAYEPHTSVSDLQSRLTDHGQRLDALEGEGESVRASLTASTADLSPEEERLFILLAVFGGHAFSAAAAAAVVARPAPDVVSALRRLVLLSLCQATQSGRYQLHSLVHTLALERFTVHPQRAPAQARFLDFFAELATRHQQLADHEVLASERAHLRKAFLHTLEDGPPSAHYALAMALAGLLMMQGALAEAQEILVRARESLPLPAHVEQARLLTRQGVILSWEGAYSHAVSVLKQGLQHAQAEEEETLQAEVLAELVAAISQGNVQEASLADYVALLRRLLSRLQAPRQKVVVLNNLGVVAQNKGDLDQARAFFEQALQLADHPRHSAALHNNLGELALLVRNLPVAEAHLATALHLCQARGLERTRVRVQNNLGRLSYAKRDFQQAHDHYEAALQLSQRWAFSQMTFIIYNDMVELALAGGDVPGARSLLRAARDLPGRERHPRTEAFLAYALGRLSQDDADALLNDRAYRRGLAQVRR